MDEVILKNTFKLYHEKHIPEGIMPMTIEKLGNSSTATVPTLLDMVVKGRIEGQEINPGDYIILCSVGSGMNINSIVYKRGKFFNQSKYYFVYDPKYQSYRSVLTEKWAISERVTSG